MTAPENSISVEGAELAQEQSALRAWLAKPDVRTLSLYHGIIAVVSEHGNLGIYGYVLLCRPYHLEDEAKGTKTEEN